MEDSSGIGSKKPTPTSFTSSTPVNHALDDLVDLVIRDFLHSWYHDFTADEEFADEIRRTLAHALRTLETRLRRLSLPDLVEDVVRIVTSHFRDYRQCVDKAGTNYGGVQELDDLFHSVQPHPALQLPLTEVRYFRRLTDRLLAYILPAEEYATPTVQYLVREILTNVVWKALLNTLSDPCTWYELVVKLVIQRRTLDIGHFTPELRWVGMVQSTTAITLWKENHPKQWQLLINQSRRNNESTQSPTDGPSVMAGSPTTQEVTVESLLQEAQATSIQPDKRSPNFFIPSRKPVLRSSLDDILARHKPAQSKSTESKQQRSSEGPNGTPSLTNTTTTKHSRGRPRSGWRRWTHLFSTLFSLALFMVRGCVEGFRFLTVQLWTSIAVFFSTYTFSTFTPPERTTAKTRLFSPRSGSTKRLIPPLLHLTDESLQLSRTQGWAILHCMYFVIPLADLLGGCLLERWVHTKVAGLFQEEEVASYIDNLRQALWPQGHFIKDKPSKSAQERELLRRDAELLIQHSLPAWFVRLYQRPPGPPSSVDDDGQMDSTLLPTKLVLDPFHSQQINKHLVLYLVDYFIGQLFPEMMATEPDAVSR
ncbi:hypothetical protein IWQ62_004333 [Dispira parvispora]|uniref:PXA domain-containing protein n=1 Tax=Dispira parvispora TaxID=1520584 RepID=A0A9W8E5I1_9FUNG|nr:hypothetical protein IWQ62_004333 [Dispira parvispora]